VTGAEVVAVVAPITTLAGALGGVWLTQRYQRGRELRDAERGHDRELRDTRRGAYVRWVQVAEDLDALSIGPGARFADFLLALQDRQAELDLVGSEEVRLMAVQYIDALGPVNEQVSALVQQLGRRPPSEQESAAFADALEPVLDHRERVLKAMRRDLGFE
jgi:hypothetical protein